jgi:hypothetical protein
MNMHGEEECPVPISLLGQLYRSSPEGLAVLTRTVPPNARATLAFYCYRRAHLQNIGLAIAGTCTEAELVDRLGRVGHDVFAHAQEAAGQTSMPQPALAKSRRGVTLASGPLWQPPVMLDEPDTANSTATNGCLTLRARGLRAAHSIRS